MEAKLPHVLGAGEQQSPFAPLLKIHKTACGNGAQGRNRTTDTVIFSHVLYQLSYLGAGLASEAW